MRAGLRPVTASPPCSCCDFRLVRILSVVVLAGLCGWWTGKEGSGMAVRWPFLVIRAAWVFNMTSSTMIDLELSKLKVFQRNFFPTILESTC